MTAVGLVGTGYWAATIHAPAIAGLAGTDAHGIWGRNTAERDRIAASHGLHAYGSFDELLASVDLVDFAVPPAAQVDMAVRAAEAGRHMLLEKPMALSVPDARRVDAAVSEAGVEALVFLTRLFEPVRSEWLREQARMGHTHGHVEWISATLAEGSPYAASAWRREGGALWDVGPHIVSQLEAVLGPVTAVSVTAHDPVGETRLLLRHQRGAVSTVTMTMHADPADKTETFEFSGPRRQARSPGTPLDFPASFRRALTTLVAQVEGQAPPNDAAHSTRASVVLTGVLCAIEALIRDGTLDALVPVPAYEARSQDS
jgi:predicted dehydrogenase